MFLLDTKIHYIFPQIDGINFEVKIMFLLILIILLINTVILISIYNKIKK